MSETSTPETSPEQGPRIPRWSIAAGLAAIYAQVLRVVAVRLDRAGRASQVDVRRASQIKTAVWLAGAILLAAIFLLLGME